MDSVRTFFFTSTVSCLNINFTARHVPHKFEHCYIHVHIVFTAAGAELISQYCIMFILRQMNISLKPNPVATSQAKPNSSSRKRIYEIFIRMVAQSSWSVLPPLLMLAYEIFIFSVSSVSSTSTVVTFVMIWLTLCRCSGNKRHEIWSSALIYLAKLVRVASILFYFFLRQSTFDLPLSFDLYTLK